MNEKVIEFLQQNAKIEEAAPTTPLPPEEPAPPETSAVNPS
jgi:hypothetical protein